MGLRLLDRIRALIGHQEKAVDQLKSRKEKLEELLAGISIEPQVFIGLVNPRRISSDDLYRYTDFSNNLYLYAEQAKLLIGNGLARLSRKIRRLEFRIKRLKISAHYFKRNLRTYIRQIHHFILGSLDDTDEASILNSNIYFMTN
ncbi:MAG: hypothetical protein AABY93_14240 [Bacteroidota bacterium]